MTKIISETDGRISGFESNFNGLLKVQFDVCAFSERVGCEGELITFALPYNRNRPLRINLEEYRNKKVHVIVEMED